MRVPFVKFGGEIGRYVFSSKEVRDERRKAAKIKKGKEIADFNLLRDTMKERFGKNPPNHFLKMIQREITRSETRKEVFDKIEELILLFRNNPNPTSERVLFIFRGAKGLQHRYPHLKELSESNRKIEIEKIQKLFFENHKNPKSLETHGLIWHGPISSYVITLARNRK